MNNLQLEKTKSSPAVNLNAVDGVCSIIGSSYPENASELYIPIFEWLNRYMIELTRDLEFNFKLDYLNSNSIRFISELMEKLEQYSKTGVNVVVNWHYEEDDIDIMELGEEFRDELTCKFNLIAD